MLLILVTLFPCHSFFFFALQQKEMYSKRNEQLDLNTITKQHLAYGMHDSRTIYTVLSDT